MTHITTYDGAEFYRYIASGKLLPKLEWTHKQKDNKLQVEFNVDEKLVEFRSWLATSSKRDFRTANWLSVPAEEKSEFIGQVEIHQNQYAALFGEFVFIIHGHPCPFSTQINIGKIQGPATEKSRF